MASISCEAVEMHQKAYATFQAVMDKRKSWIDRNTVLFVLSKTCDDSSSIEKIVIRQSIGGKGVLRRSCGCILLARHGERLDRVHKAQGKNWQKTASRPWDSPLTPLGVAQAKAMGTATAEHMRQIGGAPVKRIFCSPFLRTVETAAAAAAALGLNTICLEPALVEGMQHQWYRSWALPGSNSKWGGPADLAHVNVYDIDESKLRVEAKYPSYRHLNSQADLVAPASAASGGLGIRILSSSGYQMPPLQYKWGHFESDKAMGERVGAFVDFCVKSFPNESIILVSHGFPTKMMHRHLTRSLPDQSKKKECGYCALYVCTRPLTSSGAWGSPVVADTSHLIGVVAP